MTKEIRCFGCGAIIQSDDVKKIGYVPKNAANNEDVLCQRCFKIKNYHQLSASPLTSDDFLKLLQGLSQKDALFVYMLDIFDFNGSEIQGLGRHLGNKDILVVVNKMDLIPKSVNPRRILNWVQHQLKLSNIKPLDVCMVSTKNKSGLDDVFGAIDHFRDDRDVYVIGMTNVGKSSLLNALIKNFSEDTRFITTSEYPGTTLDVIEIPLGDASYIYDTPGIVSSRQITHYVNPKDLPLILPTSEIKQRSYQLNPEQTLYIGGLARMDFVSGEKTSFSCYFSQRLDIHRTKLVNADGLYNRHMTLKIEAEDVEKVEDMHCYDFHPDNRRYDLYIAGLGWICFEGERLHLRVYVKEGVDVILRDHLI